MTQTNDRKSTNLYNRDYVAWADEQALLLEQDRFDELDLINLVEEVRDLGIRERDAIENQLIRLFLHLLKWQYQADKRTSSWELSIKDARRQIRRLCDKYPVLRKHLYNENVNYNCYFYARQTAADETNLPLNTFPVDYVAYSIEKTLNSDFFPETKTDLTPLDAIKKTEQIAQKEPASEQEERYIALSALLAKHANFLKGLFEEYTSFEKSGQDKAAKESLKRACEESGKIDDCIRQMKSIYEKMPSKTT